MRLFLSLVDSRPAYLEPSRQASLLLMPVGGGSLLSDLCAGVGASVRGPVTVFTSFESDDAYEAALRQQCSRIDAVLPAASLAQRLEGLEPSDWLLLVDPRCYPVGGIDLERFLDAAGDDPRWARHLVGIETSPGGTKEFVQYDAAGKVRRIQRYYDFVTWPFASGVACTLLPVASALIARELPCASLLELRAALAARGVPSHDLGTPGGYFDLSCEHGILGLAERRVLELVPPTAGSAPRVGKECQVHSTARMLGPVLLQDGVVVEEGVTIVGPTLVGAGSRIGAGATLAHCLVTPGTQVQPAATLRECVVQAANGEPSRDVPVPRAGRGPAYGALDLSEERAPQAAYPQLKAFLEIPLAMLALVLLSPLLLLIAAVIKLDSRGPVLYGDKREGRHGRFFRCWKFRSMVADAHARQQELSRSNQVDGPQFKMDHDPRITRVGRWLRPTSLDELPQLINVALGQMSFVGPRPSPFRENQMCVPWREARLSVRPGITGLWQVCRNDRASGDFHQWIYYDLLYVRHAAPLVDLKIAFATLVTGGGRGCVPLSWILPPHKYYDRRRGRRLERDRAEAEPLRRIA